MLLQMIEQNPVSIVLTNPAGDIEYVNGRFTTLTGYEAAEVLGRNPRILQSGLTPPAAFQEMWRTIPHRIWRGEFANRKKSGEIYWESVTIGPIRNESGEIVHYLAVKEDITRRKRAEAERQALKERLRIAASIASDVIYEVDVTTRRITLLSSLHEDWPLRAEDVPNTIEEWLRGIHHDDRERMRLAFDRHLRSLEPFHEEYRSVRSGQQCTHWRSRAVPVHDSDGCVTKWLSVLIDISAAKQAEQQLAELAERLRVKNQELEEALRKANAATEVKSRFLANMSHEIRTPLNGIIGTAELLLLHMGSARERYDCAATIRDCGHSLLTVLNDVLDVSKLEAGKLTVLRVRHSPRCAVRDAVQLMRPVAAAKGLVVEEAVSPGVPAEVYGDPARIAQILTNLISNAIKFTDQGRIAVGLCVTSSGAGDVLEYSVADTGIGIPEDQQQSIFDSFVQVDDSLARRYGGTGLGLSICRQLSRLMGGDIGVASRPGQGSTFRLRIPLEPAQPEVCSVHRRYGWTHPSRSGQKASILVVEDNPLNQRITQRLLEKAGHSVTTAGDGHQALDQLSRESYDLILMDVQMPGMDGLEAVRRIRAGQEPARSVPIIALTANAMACDREQYLRAGMTDYLAKPVSYADLLAKIDRNIRPGSRA